MKPLAYVDLGGLYMIIRMTHVLQYLSTRHSSVYVHFFKPPALMLLDGYEAHIWGSLLVSTRCWSVWR
jgi:hypothetical protein